ncbi:uncharacterized protein BX663DRAFT_557201 [Cokeromyces recurvatus]|uniref:uncharacterized protein n=1 Tax=Cokeromyces recurvatus TaxID=90255 RepID=UPI00221F0E2A|nr:uncharacterized protein BX663DRAFT_557201 [Cokeromyces recurvatus]KAI7908002.1 hypothetical protein BX663DRAFT_557201 [Cokeromyces recurvatus]
MSSSSPSSSSKKNHKHLEKKEKCGKVLLLNVNEFRTLSLCHSCLSRNLRHSKSEDITCIHHILICNDCGILWNANMMAYRKKHVSHFNRDIGWPGMTRYVFFLKKHVYR